MDIQRLRNLTTRRLHTEIQHIYEDLEEIIGDKGLMTHMLPGVCEAITPWLRDKVIDPRFWDGLYDVTHIGEIDLPTPTAEERAEMFRLYKEQPSIFDRR